MRVAREALTLQWLERIAARVAMEPNRLFPTNELLDHVPVLVDGIAAYVDDPRSVVSADMAVVAKARELGALRYEQGFDQFEILKEFEILGDIVLHFVGTIADESPTPCTRAELLACALRVFHALCLIQEATSAQFLQLTTEHVAEREDRLRAFNRTLTHEFRNRIGASLGAGELLAEPNISTEKRIEFANLIVRNARGMQMVLDNLLELSRVGSDARRHRHVRLSHAARAVLHELREMAGTLGLALRLAPDLPDVEVNAAAVELCLTNLVSNAIKYCDQTRGDRWVEIRARVANAPGTARREVVVEVADNGIGVPARERERLFARFFRSNGVATQSVNGTGLGLSIVRETVAALGGRVWAEFPNEGSVFAFTLPCRRRSDTRGGRSRTATRPPGTSPQD
ncbi:MAG TPA: HAMP domain-containing sensor histidine kinase [Candidatus Elarobacter sp.]|nr:HAMP domain-containing sensor histidine kinase [Candidatus Elarobacter sp.]